MFGKIVFLMVIAFGATACAEPKYEVASAPKGNFENPKPAEAECLLQFKNSGHCLTWTWEKYPTESEAGTLSFKVFRPNLHDGTPVQIDLPELPAVVLWMPAMGHGSSPTKVSQADVGTFVVSNVFFVMPGEWQIKFQIKNGATVQDEAIVSLVF